MCYRVNWVCENIETDFIFIGTYYLSNLLWFSFPSTKRKWLISTPYTKRNSEDTIVYIYFIPLSTIHLSNNDWTLSIIGLLFTLALESLEFLDSVHCSPHVLILVSLNSWKLGIFVFVVSRQLIKYLKKPTVPYFDKSCGLLQQGRSLILWWADTHLS